MGRWRLLAVGAGWGDARERSRRRPTTLDDHKTKRQEEADIIYTRGPRELSIIVCLDQKSEVMTDEKMWNKSLRE